MHQKKVISKTSLTTMSKSEKSAFFRHVFANNFFWYIFSKLFQRIRNHREILHFLTPFPIFSKKFFFYVILVLFSNFDCKCAGNGSKNGKSFFMNVSQNLIMQPSKGLHNQVVKIVVPYCAASLFPKQNYNVLSPNYTIHISVRDLYISRLGLSILLQPWTDHGNI